MFYCLIFLLAANLGSIRAVVGGEACGGYSVANGLRSSTVYVEGDASIGTYQDGEGKTRSSLNIVQRT